MLGEKEKEKLFREFVRMIKPEICESFFYDELLWTNDDDEYEYEDTISNLLENSLDRDGVQCGASKLVLIPSFTDKWVFKIPLRGAYYKEGGEKVYTMFDHVGSTLDIPGMKFPKEEWDHCLVESTLTEVIERDHPGIADIFAKTYCIGTYGAPVYVSEKCPVYWHEKYQNIVKSSDFLSSRSKYSGRVKGCDLVLDQEVIFVMQYGLRKANQLFDFLDKTGISDLHGGNLAFDYQEKPRIIDYSGYGYQSWY